MTNEETTLCQQLTKLLGYKKFRKIGTRCTGSWAGTTDYYLLFDEKVELFISNGIAPFAACIKTYIQELQTFEKYKEDMFRTICNQVEKDNLTAAQEGLLPVKCISLDINKEPTDYFLWPFIRMEVAGCQFNLIETGVKYAIFENKLNEIFERQNEMKIFTAGAVEKPTFIFNNTRFSHLDNLYKLKLLDQNGQKSTSGLD